MTEELNVLPVWITILIYDFKTHTVKCRLESDVEITYRMNPILEAQIHKVIDSGHTPRRIKCFIQENEITSLLDYEHLSKDLSVAPAQLDDLSFSEGFKQIKKGVYPESVAKKHMVKLRDQLKLEIDNASLSLQK